MRFQHHESTISHAASALTNMGQWCPKRGLEIVRSLSLFLITWVHPKSMDFVGKKFLNHSNAGDIGM